MTKETWWVGVVIKLVKLLKNFRYDWTLSTISTRLVLKSITIFRVHNYNVLGVNIRCGIEAGLYSGTGQCKKGPGPLDTGNTSSFGTRNWFTTKWNYTELNIIKWWQWTAERVNETKFQWLKPNFWQLIDFH